MADNTRNQTHIREIEERLNTRMEERFMDIGASLQHKIDDMFRRHENSCSSGSSSSSRPYSCNTRLAHLDFPRFNGEGIKNWIIQCDTFFSGIKPPKSTRCAWLWSILKAKLSNGIVRMWRIWDSINCPHGMTIRKSWLKDLVKFARIQWLN